MAIDFVGNGDYLEDSGGEIFLNGLTDFSISIWVNSDVTATDRGFLYGGAPSGNDRPLSFRYDAAGATGGGTNLIKFGCGSATVQCELESSNNTQTTSWQHLVLIRRNGFAPVLYINGVLDTPTATTATTVTVADCTSFRIGMAAKDTAGTSWNGRVADVRLYNRLLSGAEALSIYSCRGMDMILNGLLFRYPLNDIPPGVVATSVKDVGTSVRTATNSGSPTGFDFPVPMKRRTASVIM